MKRVNVDSSNLASVGYDHDSKVLEIAFRVTRHGVFYRYFDVPAEVHEGLMTAKSKGSFFHKNIKGAYRYEQDADPVVG